MKTRKIAIFVLPLVLSLGILMICYPGFMSYDSVWMLEEARSFVRGGTYPPAPVYLLRLFDVFGNGPTLMVMTQNYILLLSMMLILHKLKAGLLASAITMLAIIAMPVVIGGMLVLWKDVTVTSALLLSMAMIFWASMTDEESTQHRVLKWTSLIFLLVATLVRFNAITSTALVAIYWVTVFGKNQNWRMRAGTFSVILICMVTGNKVINEYRLPSFQKLNPNTIVYGIMATDLIGISGWSRESLIPLDTVESGSSPKVLISDIDDIYSSMGILQMEHNIKVFGNRVNIFPSKFRSEDTVNAWVAAVTAHPMAYARFRWDLFSEIIGATAHETYEPTHYNRIDENSFGIKFQDRHITELTLKYIKSASNKYLGKPWVVFLLSFLSAILVFGSHRIPPNIKMFSHYSFAAMLLYIMPFYFIAATGEVRYSFPAIVLSTIPILVWIFSLNKPILARLN